MDTELQCDFYLGDRLYLPIKLMDYFSLKNFKGIVKFIPLIAPLYWQKGSVQLIFKSCYTNYIIDGEAYNLSNWFILLLGKLLGKKVYTWQHGWYGRESFLKKIIKKLQAKLAYHIFLYGDYARGIMLKENIPARKMSCIYNSLDYDAQLPIRQKLDFKNNHKNIYLSHFGNTNPTLIFLGRLTKRKQLDLLIEVVNKLNNEKKCPVNLILVGKGETEEKLKTLAKKHNLTDKIWFYGECYDEETNARLLYDADICVSPGDVGLTAIHSFMFGCPVITHQQFQNQVPEFEIIEPDISGKFFEKNSLSDMAKKIQEFLDYATHNRENIKQACYHRVDEYYNPNYQIELLEKILST
jgi:glycosyltransferase involved in cell wall biosynthesis